MRVRGAMVVWVVNASQTLRRLEWGQGVLQEAVREFLKKLGMAQR